MWDGSEVVLGTLPQGSFPTPRTDRAHLAYVHDVFLPRAREAGVVSPSAVAALLDYARALDSAAPDRAPATVGAARPVAGSAGTGRPTARGWTAAGPTPGTRPPGTRTPGSGPAPVQPVVPPPHEPGPIARWWDRTKETVGSDLAAHGLAYLGVLLLFVGVFGLVAFAFGDVAEAVRPLAELGIALTPFLASWMLLRRGAQIAGRALETAGGLLLPIMILTSFLDGVPVPPDATGPTLVVALTAVTLCVSAAYALWSLRHHGSTLRYLVAPVAWLAVALATMGLGQDIPSGKAVATVSAAQTAAIGLAMLASLVWAWVRPHALLSAPTFTAAIPGLVIVGPLAVLTWAVGGWPEVAVAVTGVTGLLLLELMIGRLQRSIVTTIQPLWWAVVALALVPSLGLPAAAACAAAGFVALLELEHSDGSSTTPVVLSAVGLGVSVLCLWSEPWWAFAVLVALTAWAQVRRLRPYGVPHAELVLDLAAALVPMGAVVALGMASRNPSAAVLVGSSLAALAAWPATHRRAHSVLARDAGDHFWVLWWDAAMVVSVLALALMFPATWSTAASAEWMLVGATGVLVLGAATGPLPRELRAWIVLGLVTWTWVRAASALSLTSLTVAVVVAVLALVVVAWSHVLPDVLQRWSDAGSTALAGLALGVAAIAAFAVVGGWALTTTVGLATAAWAVTTAYAAIGRSPAAELAVRVTAPDVRYLPATVTALGIPATVLLALDAAGIAGLTSTSTGLVLSATAVVYAGATRLPLGDVVRSVLLWTACAFAIVAPMLTTEARPALAALVCLVVTAGVLPPQRRPDFLVWVSWAALAPIAALVLMTGTSAYDGRPTETAFAVTMVLVGSALLLVAAALDLRGRGWVPVWRPTHPSLLPLAVLGATEVAAGLAVSTSAVTGATAGAITAVVAVVVVATGTLARAWSLLGLGSALAWMAVLQLRGDDVLHSPWLAVLATVLLLAAAEAGHRVVRDARLWVRADWTLALVAHVPAVTALAAAGNGVSFSRTYAAVGIIALLVALRVRRMPLAAGAYGVTGTGLVLVGAATAGPGWLALALAATSIGCSVVAAKTTDAVRWALIVTGALTAFGAWLSLTSWLDWTARQTVDRTVLLGAGVALVSAALLRWTRADRTVVGVRGGLAVAAATLTPFAPNLTFGDGSFVVTSSTLAAAAVVAVALGIAARPLAAQGLRYVALAYALAAGAQTSYLFGWTSAQLVAALSVTAAATSVALLLPVGRDLWASWRGPDVTLALIASLTGVGVAMTQLPDTGLLTVALLVCAGVSSAIAVETRSLLAQLCTPVLVCAAWIVYAAGALDGNPQWFAVPVGLTILVIVGLLRHRLRATGDDPAASEVVLLESTGVACIVTPSFVQAFTVGLGYAALACFLGLLVAGWGMLTQVRRRVTTGAVVCLAALLVLVGVPMSRLLPAWTGVTLWVTIAGIGLLAIVGATLLEKGRAVVRAGITSFREMTEGWE